MRPEPASNRTSTRQIALVLADPGIGELLCEGLREQGFETRLDTPPSLNTTIEQLRAVLRSFVQREQRPGAQLWVHPGVTPLAERSEWSALSRELGFQFIGPPSRSLSLFNNRLNLLGEAEKMSISNLLLSPDPLHSIREIEKLIRTNRFKLPFVLKSVRGGSGFGVRVIHQPEDLGKSLGLWLEQIRRSIGEVIILAERYVEGARRIVQPFVRYADGRLELLPAIDASLTSRLRKIVEFCPALANQDPSTDGVSELKQVREWTQALVHRTGYVGVGSLEYLVDGTRAFLIEGVPRLNTSFHLWEKVAGISAVELQLAAMGREQRHPVASPTSEWRSSIALRIHAEDPILQLPQPGLVIQVGEKQEWSFPGAVAKLRMAVPAGGELPISGSSLLGYLWIGAEDRKRAITVVRGLLEELWIAGSVQTNERFLSELMSHPWVQESMFHASFVDEEFIPSIRAEAAVLNACAAMAQLLYSNAGGDPGATGKWAVGDQWIRSTSEPGFHWTVEPTYFSAKDRDGRERKGLSGTLQTGTGQHLRAFCIPIAEERWQARVGNWFLQIRRVAPKSGAQPSGKQKLTSLITGKVHSVLFREGVWVPAHEPALLVESLGSLVPHALPVDVRIVRWQVGAEDLVHAGQVLAEFERAPQVR